MWPAAPSPGGLLTPGRLEANETFFGGGNLVGRLGDQQFSLQAMELGEQYATVEQMKRALRIAFDVEQIDGRCDPEPSDFGRPSVSQKQ